MSPMAKDVYEERRARRIERLKERAAKKRSEGESRVNQAHERAQVIPFGQPILVGHHSEKRDRRYRAKIESGFRKGFELMDEASRLEDRAQAAEQNRAIFSDDPAATEKLTEKLERLQKRQELMKAANKLVKKKDKEGLAALGFSPTRVEELFIPDFCGRVGFPDYEITNNGANMRRIKERIKILEREAKDSTSEVEINGIRVVDSVEDNRVMIYFPGKPAESVRQALKHNGFRWSPSSGAWQSYRGAYYLQRAKQIAESCK